MTTLIEKVRNRRQLPPPEVLRAMRVTGGAKQGEIADELKVHRVTVARWEAGLRRPTGELRDRYLRLLYALNEEVSS